jgi:hypothetical protein
MAGATPPNPQPTGITAWTLDGSGLPSSIFLLYMLSLDSVVRSICAGNIGPLTNAANDTAAAAAGVQINGLYRNGNAVQIRLV